MNSIIDNFDVLLADYVSDENIFHLDTIKSNFRQLLIEIQKDISELQTDNTELKSRLLALEQLDVNVNTIEMGHIALQLRNKMIRFIKPDLSRRAASDEYLQSLQSEDRFSILTDLIKKYESSMDVCALGRSITALKKHCAGKSYDERLMTNAEIDSVLAEFISANDPYLNQQAKIVVRFLKILAEQLKEPMIVDLD